MAMKQISAVSTAPPPHWVGDGFPVRSLFSYNGRGDELSPFLLLDYAGPMDFPPGERPRGVGEHPHRGFETVTIVYAGEVAHRDSTGAGGTIGPGDVQWMTAASGILHDEFHSPDFTRDGGTLEMVQLWVNLPARHKMSAPKYQNLKARDIPALDLPDAGGTLRVIAGEFDGIRGTAETFTPVDVWDVELNAHASVNFEFEAGRTAAIVVLKGEVVVNDQTVKSPGMALFDRRGRDVTVHSNNGATILVLSGEPLNEPIVGYGPFVMNTREEIEQALVDFKTGRFGRMPGA